MNYAAVSRLLVRGELGPPAELVTQASREARQQGVPLRQVLLQQSNLDERTLLERAAEAGGTRYLELGESEVTAEAIQAVSPSFATHYRIVPVSVRNGEIVLATDDPFDEHLPEELALLLNRRVRLVLATSKAIARAIRRCYGVGADTVEKLSGRNGAAAVEETRDSDLADENAARDASVIKLLNQVLMDAIQHRATDIHFEPYEDELRVRYRIDGVLRDAGVPAAARHYRHALVSRAKIMGNLDIAERRLPQDGRAQVNLGGQAYDLRISILPTPHGEALNVRILSRNTTIGDLQSLGFEGRDLEKLLELVRIPHGIILVTGPTGSGKTTTLYTVLRLLNKAETKILTVEDPVEYRMQGVTQMQVNPEIGFTFARALRSMLRHDPDVMLIGEIRDFETAEITIRTALTGHLVFSTLHTNDAPTAMGRLIDMGVEPFLIASSVEGVLAQRLVRLVCPNCREWYEPDPLTLRQLGPEAAGLTRLARGRGCGECRFTGLWGRTCITELMLMDGALREMVAAKRHADDLRREAVRRGMRPLRSSGIRKIERGLTTVEEVLRVTPSPEAESSVLVEPL